MPFISNPPALKTSGGYYWNSWTAPDLSGTLGNGPAAGTTLANAPLYTFANASGTLTITFLQAGTYAVSVRIRHEHANVYASAQFNAPIGGTATIFALPAADIDNRWVDSTYGANQDLTNTFFVTATAGQTITILPKFGAIQGNGAATQHTAFVSAMVDYKGA